MKKLLFLALIAYTAWYGWNHRDQLPTMFKGAPHSEAVIENISGRPVTRVRLDAGGTVVVREALAVGESATLEIPLQTSGNFSLQWQWGDAPGEPRWRGNLSTSSTGPQRYRFQIPAFGPVISSSGPMPAAGTR